jgi:SAM-dependent methyltransferase
MSAERDHSARPRRRQVACKVCGAFARFAYSIENVEREPPRLDVYRCTNCRILSVGPELMSANITSAYRAQDVGLYYEEVGGVTRRKAARALADVERVLERTSDPSVLDVGCGLGHFLEALCERSPHVRAAGLELPGATADAAAVKGFRVFTGGLDEIDERFSVAVLLDVAEHLPDPVHVFAQCNALLEPRGYLYLHTPRLCIWDELFLALVRVRPLRRTAQLWLRSRVSIFHLQLWTDKALRLALERTGFRVVDLRKELELSWPIWRYVNVYLERRGIPRPVVSFVAVVAEVVFVRMRLVRNKAICLAEKAASPGIGFGGGVR